jgi:hypothetical protein
MQRLVLLLVPVLFLLQIGVAAAATPHFSLGLGVDYARGDFGSDSTSTYMAIPLIFDWFPDERLNLELTVPFVYQDTTNTGYAATGGGAMAMIGGRGMNQSAGSVAFNGDEKQSGLGDITLVTAYKIILDGKGTPDLGLTCYLKFPTADEDKGLGTGAFDWGPGLQLSKWLGSWQPFAEGRYIFQGSSADEIGASDYFLVDAGVGYGWSDKLYTALFSRFGSAAFDGLDAPLDVRLKTVWKISDNNTTEMYLLKGVSDGSPDYGAGISFYVSF